MTPRPDIVAVPLEATLAELRQVFLEQQYSRVPVYKDTLDHIQGFVFIKDLIRMTDAQAERPGRAQAAAAGVLRARDQARLGPAEGVPAPAGAVGRRRRRVRRHRGPGHARGPARGDRRRDSRRVRRRGRAGARRRQRRVRLQRQGGHRRAGRAARRRRSRATASARSAATCCRTSAACRRWARPSRSAACASRCSKPSGGAWDACACSAWPRRRRPRPPESRREGRVRLAGRPAQRRQVHAAQSPRRHQAGDRLRQAADHAHADPRRAHLSRGPGRLRRHARHPSADAPHERADAGHRARRDARRGRRRRSCST